MITGAIKNKVDKIWTDIWAGGIANPLTVIEQLTYLMFIRSLDEKELENEEFENMTGEQMPKIFPQSEVGQSMRWSKFKDDDPRRIFEVMSQRVFPAIKSMKYGRLPDFNEKGELIEIEDEPGRADENTTAFARYMNNAMFLIPTPQLLQKIITGLDDLYEHDIAELDKIINHIEQNGYMESVTILTKPPFDKPLSFTKLFDRKMQSEIMATINKVKDMYWIRYWPL